MSAINGSSMDYSSFYSNLFGGSSNSSNSLGLGGMLTDYASIRNGSYTKLLKAHYAKQEQEKTGATDEEKKEVNKAYSSVKSAAQNLSDAADALSANSLYQKGSYQVTDSKGEKTDSDYNYDAIYDKLNSFVDSYNSLLNAAGSEKAASTNHLALNMASSTTRNSNLLSKIGVTQDKDGKLSIDRDKFNKSDINTIKTLFQGSGGYGDSVSNRADMMASIATNKIGSNSTYNSKAAKDAASLDSSLFSSTV